MAQTDNIGTRICQPGEVIFSEGDPGADLYLIISGSVEIFKETENDRQLINRLGDGEIFGEMSALTHKPRYASATAMERTRLIIINDKTFGRALINEEMPIIKPLAKQLVVRLKEAEAQKQQSLQLVKDLEDELLKARQ